MTNPEALIEYKMFRVSYKLGHSEQQTLVFTINVAAFSLEDAIDKLKADEPCVNVLAIREVRRTVHV